MTAIPILNGVFADSEADFRTSYPRNLVPVPKKTGIANGYLRPADGIAPFGVGGPGVDRGGINWNGVCYRVMGTKLVSVDAAGSVTVRGNVGAGGPVTMDPGFDRLAIWSGGGLYYWDGGALTQVTDPDLGTVIDGRFIAGYFMSTDGTSLIVTDLNDPMAVNPLHYGSAEADPDQILAVDELRREAYALGRYSIEVFQNVGGTGFPFAPIDGAQIPRGVVGTHAYAPCASSFAFVGSGRNEAPGVWIMLPGDSNKLSTREVDLTLAGYTEAQLAGIVVETRIEKGCEQLMIHLPDQCLVYDVAASAAAQERIWFTLASSIVGTGTYRARSLVRCYDRWIVGDPTSSALGSYDSSIGTHYGEMIGWDFGTLIVYGEGASALINDLELVCLPGRVPLGADPVIWTSYSFDGQAWSPEKPVAAGKQGERLKRIAWRRQGTVRHYRMQRFRGTSDAFLSMARLEAEFEGLANG